MLEMSKTTILKSKQEPTKIFAARKLRHLLEDRYRKLQLLLNLTMNHGARHFFNCCLHAPSAQSSRSLDSLRLYRHGKQQARKQQSKTTNHTSPKRPAKSPPARLPAVRPFNGHHNNLAKQKTTNILHQSRSYT